MQGRIEVFTMWTRPSPHFCSHLVCPISLPGLSRMLSLSCWSDRSSSSADRLLSHGDHVIPFPVSHQEFWPFPVCHPPGRQQKNETQFPRVRGPFAAGGCGRSRSFCMVSFIRANISISLIATVGHGQAVTLSAKDSMTLPYTSIPANLF